jgi:hypothetical protein
MQISKQNLSMVVAAVTALASTGVAQAQTPAPGAQPAGGLYTVTQVVVKADHVATYRDYLKKLSDGYKKAGARSFSVYVAVAGNPLEYVLVRPVPNYAAADEAPILNKAYSDIERARLNTQRDQCTESAHISFQRMIAVVGEGDPRTFRVVTRFRARPGMAEAYTAAIQNELLPALKKVEGIRYRARHVEWGGSRSEFVTTNDMDKLATLDKPSSPSVQAFGQEGAVKWAKKMAELGTNVDAQIYRFIPELSYGPAAK